MKKPLRLKRTPPPKPVPVNPSPFSVFASGAGGRSLFSLLASGFSIPKTRIRVRKAAVKVAGHHQTCPPSPVVRVNRPKVGPKPEISLDDLPFNGT